MRCRVVCVKVRFLNILKNREKKKLEFLKRLHTPKNQNTLMIQRLSKVTLSNFYYRWLYSFFIICIFLLPFYYNSFFFFFFEKAKMEYITKNKVSF